MLDLSLIDKSWTLFLDRDGVINVDKSPYTLSADQFEFYPDVPEKIAALSKIFGQVIVVTNQRGIGREMMTEKDLAAIHAKMVAQINDAGGHIDHIYYCPSVDNTHPDRKPNPGMALKAMQEYPRILAVKSLIVGNNLSDMHFGRNAGFHTVLVGSTGTKVELPHELVDLQFPSLTSFADYLIKQLRSPAGD